MLRNVLRSKEVCGSGCLLCFFFGKGFCLWIGRCVYTDSFSIISSCDYFLSPVLAFYMLYTTGAAHAEVSDKKEKKKKTMNDKPCSVKTGICFSPAYVPVLKERGVAVFIWLEIGALQRTHVAALVGRFCFAGAKTCM